MLEDADAGANFLGTASLLACLSGQSSVNKQQAADRVAVSFSCEGQSEEPLLPWSLGSPAGQRCTDVRSRSETSLTW
jgi:hypothetical protein